jgi:hypothetical protein
MSTRQYGYTRLAGRAHILRATYGDTSRALCGTILQRLETESHPALPAICRRCRSIEAAAVPS